MLEKGLSLAVEVKTGAKCAGLLGFNRDTGALKIALKAKPIEGKANRELIKVLEKKFGKNARIVRGLKSRKKEVFVEGLENSELEKILEK
ncbi:YggU family protein [Candidatus Micrarchaeota archaeon]|nr:YggU family protein [Candidatus Micrarchaeota archaeon]MBU1940093.1 YggU family protein [Candidatus Micrarchaeota archaeon]